jgi:hypothetical protein
MINQVNASGNQAYAYQQSSAQAAAAPPAGDNRVQPREAPAADSQKQDPREFASRDSDTPKKSASAQGRGGNVNVSV